MQAAYLCSQDADTASILDFLLSIAREEFGLDGDGLLGQLALAQALEDAKLSQVNERRSTVGLLGKLLALLKANHAPELVDVDSGHVVWVLLVVEIAHTHLTEVTRVVLVEGNSVHVLATSVTATGSVLAVLANTAVTAVHATALFPVLLLVGRLHNAYSSQEQNNKKTETSQQRICTTTPPAHPYCVSNMKLRWVLLKFCSSGSQQQFLK